MRCRREAKRDGKGGDPTPALPGLRGVGRPQDGQLSAKAPRRFPGRPPSKGAAPGLKAGRSAFWGEGLPGMEDTARRLLHRRCCPHAGNPPPAAGVVRATPAGGEADGPFAAARGEAGRSEDGPEAHGTGVGWNESHMPTEFRR